MLLGRLFAVLAALASSQTPVFSRVLKADDWTSWQVIGARAFFGAVVLYPFVATKLRSSLPHWRLIAIPAAMFVVGGTSYVYASMHAAIGVAVSVLYLSPMWVTLWERFALGQRRGGDFAACGFGILGTALIGTSLKDNTTELSGVVAALIASLSQAVYILTGSATTKKVEPSVVAFWSLLLTGAIFGGNLLSASWTENSAPYALGIGVVSGAIYFVLAEPPRG